MTVLDERPGVAAGVVEMPARRKPIGRRLASLGFVVLVVFLVSAFLVEDPVAHVWYESRQQHVAADFTNPRAPTNGAALAVLQIPARSINLVIVEGDGPGVLRGAPGHRPSSPIPGALGNSIVFGHRSGWGGPFSALGDVVVGDNVFVQTRNALGLRPPLFFRVVAVKAVSSGDRRAYASSNDHRLTLVTSDGGDASKRLLVVAVSGTVGRLAPPGPQTTVSVGSAIGSIGLPLVWVALTLGAGLVVVALGRRRHHGRAVAIVATPLFAAGVLALILSADALWRSPLS